MIYLYLFGTCFHFIYVFMIIGNFQANSQKTMLTTNQRNMSTMLRYHMRLSIL